MQDRSLTVGDIANGEAWQWWEARRLRYNIGLAAAGWVAWGLFALEVLLTQSILHQAIVSFSMSLTLAQGLAFLVIMALANVCYLLGVIGETLLKPLDAADYRWRMWRLGFGVSLMIPLLFPAIMLVNLLSMAGL